MLPMSAATRRRFLLAGALVLACTNPTEACGCTPAPLVAVLYGQVVDGAGAPIGGALVRAQVAEAGCVLAREDLGSASSTSTGQYRIQLILAAFVELGHCLRATADPPSGTAWLPSTATPFSVSFNMGTVLDSARLDLRLTGSP